MILLERMQHHKLEPMSPSSTSEVSRQDAYRFMKLEIIEERIHRGLDEGKNVPRCQCRPQITLSKLCKASNIRRPFTKALDMG